MRATTGQDLIVASNMYHQLWEVGLAVLSHRGFSGLFELINQTLDTQDIAKMQKILNLCSELSPSEQITLSDDTSTPEEVAQVVWRLEEIARERGMLI